MAQRVVITGVGVISPLGLTPGDMWKALIEGRSGVDYISNFDASSFETRFAAEVKGFDPLNYLERKEARHMDRFAQFAVAASQQAVAQANLRVDRSNENSIGVLIGSGIGGLTTLSQQVKILLEKGPDRVSPFLAPMMISDSASGQVSIALGAKGPNYCATSSCSSSSDAIGEAFEIIRRGDALAMIAGGSEAAITPIGVAAFSSARALSSRNDKPQEASRPFDAERDGFVIGEGAGVVMLESLEFALGRNASILAEVIGYGASSDAYHITQPAENGEGAARAMILALGKAGVKPEEVDYINAHGTSTPLNDKCETLATKSVFGPFAYKVAISSTKSMTGHLLGAAGGLEAAICVMALQHGLIPPTINLTHPDPECDLNYTPNVARPAEIDIVMSNTFGFGGHNSVLVFKRFKGS